MSRSKRNYRKEYDNYHASPEQKKRRAARGRARYAVMKSGGAKKGDGKDVDHKNGNPNDNRKSNLTVKSKAANRSYARTKTARKKSSKS